MALNQKAAFADKKVYYVSFSSLSIPSEILLFIGPRKK